MMFAEHLETGLWKPVGFICYDWMHCLLCCSGWFQILANLTVLSVLDSTTLTLESLDQFTQSLYDGITNHVWKPRLQNNFWTARTQTDERHKPKPLRSFASETIVAISVLDCLGRMVLLPAGELVEHFQIVSLARTICQAFQRGERDWRSFDPPAVANMLREFHVRYLQLHGESACKVKAHLSHHLPSCAASHGAVLSCFSRESRNSLFKAIARHVKNKGATPDVYVLQRFLGNIEHEVREFKFAAVTLRNPKSNMALAHLVPGVVRDLLVSNVLQRPQHTLMVKQFAFTILSDGRRLLCQMAAFLVPVRSRFDPANSEAYVVVRECVPGGKPGRWEVTRRGWTVHHTAVEGAVVVSSDGARAVVLLEGHE